MNAGRRFAYAGVGVGLTVSVAANVAHAATDGGSPWALAMSGFWPLALFLALEILTRSSWSGGRSLLVARVGVAVVAAVAAALSYAHLRGLLLSFGEAPWAASLGPLAVDGLMAVSAAALLSNGLHTAAPAAAAPAQAAEAAVQPAEAVAREVPTRAPRPAEGRPPASRGRRAQPPTAGRVSDGEILAALDTAVRDGELHPGDVTGNRLRARFGVGAERSTRLAAEWQTHHARAAGGDSDPGSAPLRAVAAGD